MISFFGNNYVSKQGKNSYTFQIKVLSALRGQSLGDTTRRIMCKLGTYKMWSQYSLKGRKGKLSFNDVSLCTVIKSKCTLKLSKHVNV